MPPLLRCIIHLPMSLNLWWRQSRKKNDGITQTGDDISALEYETYETGPVIYDDNSIVEQVKPDTVASAVQNEAEAAIVVGGFLLDCHRVGTRRGGHTVEAEAAAFKGEGGEIADVGLADTKLATGNGGG